MKEFRNHINWKRKRAMSLYKKTFRHVLNAGKLNTAVFSLLAVEQTWRHSDYVYKIATICHMTVYSLVQIYKSYVTSVDFYQSNCLDVRVSVHHGIIHKENPTRCNSVSTFYFIFIWSSVCFRRDTAHHQKPKTALAASGFAYVEGYWTCSCWTLTASSIAITTLHR
jgi:hypothetical protein